MKEMNMNYTPAVVLKKVCSGTRTAGKARTHLEKVSGERTYVDVSDRPGVKVTKDRFSWTETVEASCLSLSNEDGWNQMVCKAVKR